MGFALKKNLVLDRFLVIFLKLKNELGGLRHWMKIVEELKDLGC